MQEAQGREATNGPISESLVIDRVGRGNRILRWALAGVFMLGTATSAASHELGWILMIPPIAEDRIERNIPIAEWDVASAHDTAKECQSRLTVMFEQYEEKEKHGENVPFTKQQADRYAMGRCVPASVVYPQVKEWWIFMLPPVVFHDEKPQAQIDAPLSKWEIKKSFDTARECRAHITKSMADIGNIIREFKVRGELEKFEAEDGHPTRSVITKFLHARCVPASAVYPQVKEK